MPLTDFIAPQFPGLDEPSLGSTGLDDDVLNHSGRLVDDDNHGENGSDDDNDDGEDNALPSHPLGVRPLGNKYLVCDKEPDAKDAAGPLFGALSDELLLHLLEYLDTASLAALSAACRFLYAFCTYDELWKTLALENKNWCPPAWHGTWRTTLLAQGRSATTTTTTNPTKTTSIDCSRVFSDVLHRPFVCRTVALQRFAADIPAANQMRRLPDMTAAEFAAHWTDTPFVLTEAASVRAWPALRAWSLETLRARHATTVFRAEAVDWPYAVYDQYLQRNADESPLYLFDKRFMEKMGATATATEEGEDFGAAYDVPPLFGPDLFAVLGPQRPAHRWLIAGPRGSGSTFHKDPNGTSAWNAVLEGAKYWVLFPPAAQVPGVFVSADEGEVTSPLSIGEWLLTFHAAARAHPQCVEGVCGAGEMVHVPSGWWHLVVNLAPGVALTQNFVPPAHLAAVLRFLRDRPTQVTGFDAKTVPDPYALFVARLAETHPEALQAAQAELARRDARRKRTWDAVRGDVESSSNDDKDDAQDGKRPRATAGFTFGFAADDLEEEEEALVS